ncbi:MAG: KOW motif-containing protein [Acidobacteria bacterium]|nr:KOW motif-containing protein [Acidobacteriota bacterium]
MADIIDLSDFVRVRSGRHKGKTGMVQRMAEHSNRPTDYHVFVPADARVYRFGENELEKIDEVPGDPIQRD